MKGKRIFLSIVIPSYNEELRIESSLRKIYNFMQSQGYAYEVIISDDGSTDKTKDIVKRYQKKWKALVLLENDHKGKAPAVIKGVNSAKGQLVMFTDVDLSVPIEELPKFINWLDEHDYDVAIASREGVGAKRIGEPYLRHFMGRVFNLIVQLLVLPGINDTQCGFKMFKTKAANEIFKRIKLYSTEDPEIVGAKVSGFDVEILFAAKKLGYKIKEVPVTWTYMDNSKVHNIKDSYNNLRDVISVYLNNMRGEYS